MRYWIFMKLILLCTIFLLTSCRDSSTSDESENPPKNESAAKTMDKPSLEISQPPQIGDQAPDFTLNTLEQHSVQLLNQLAEGPVVLIVLRGWPGYQCPICTRQVGEFLTHADDLKAAQARVVLVYPGPADHLMDHAQEFVNEETLPGHFFFVIDPNYRFTLSYGLRWNAPQETAYPATFVIDRQGIVRFAKVSKTHGDRADFTEVLTVLKEIQ
jgi:peroxiredoxin Q/BCP